MQEYKILQSDSTHGLEMLVKEALNVAGMQLYGDASEFGGRKVQIVTKGVQSGSGAGGEVTPADVLVRVAEAELKAAQANLKATEAKGSADNANAQLAFLTLELSRKADLTSGKVPYDQLPEFPVGRKVNVPNKAARLALTNYTDLTIAYEADTGDAWGLDANADASLELNWSRLGNAQAVGVQSFNGRTGNIGPQQGDYITSMVPEALGKRYVTEDQIASWTAKAGPAEITAAINQALAGGDLPFETKQHATDTYLPKAQVGIPGGVAPLGADRKVPAANLPDVAVVDLTPYLKKDQRGAASGVAPLGTDSKVPAANLPAAPDLAPYMLASSRGAVGGVAPLDSLGKVSSSLLYRNAANGIAPLDADTKVPLFNLPAFMPQSQRVWRTVAAAQRTFNAFRTNNSKNEMIVFVRSTENTSASRWIRGVIRKDANDSEGPAFLSDSQAGTVARRVTLTLHVPAGYQYLIGTDGGTSAATTDTWHEMS